MNKTFFTVLELSDDLLVVISAPALQNASSEETLVAGMLKTIVSSFAKVA